MLFRLLYDRQLRPHSGLPPAPSGQGDSGRSGPAAKYSQMNSTISAAWAPRPRAKLGLGHYRALFCELDDRFGAGADHLAFDLSAECDRNAFGADAAT